LFWIGEYAEEGKCRHLLNVMILFAMLFGAVSIIPLTDNFSRRLGFFQIIFINLRGFGQVIERDHI
jgi:hypothetical protein